MNNAGVCGAIVDGDTLRNSGFKVIFLYMMLPKTKGLAIIFPFFFFEK